ncbi:MAG: hypothetical protein H7A50_06135 [Akkermansiaceae bacterium]|nr:hypothetical protein [Akkermansiaceae bacterium]
MSFHRILPLFLLGIVSAFAQEPVPAPPTAVEPPPGVPGVPVPGANAAPAGAPAAAAQPEAGDLANTKIVEDIVEPKLSGTALAGLYRKYTGRRVIVSAAAAAAEFSFVQDASPQDPLTFQQAAELLRIAAVTENFVFVPHPQNPNLDILTLATGGVRPTNVDVAVYNESMELPDEDVVITYVMTLSYLKPAEAVNTFTQIIGQFGAYGSIAAVPNASAIVITEKASLIKSLTALKEEIDVPSTKVTTRFIPVRYADVTELAETLNELLNQQQQAQTTAGIQRTDTPAAPQIPGQPPVAGQSGGSSAGETTPVQILPDARTNRIFAMGRPVDILFIEGLVREFDVETSEKNFLRRKLKFLKVYEFLPIAEDALNRAFTGTGAAGGATGGGSTAGSSGRSTGGSRQSAFSGSNRNSNMGRNSSSGFGSNNSSFGGSSSGFGGSGGGISGGSSLSAPDASTAPESVLVGRTLLVADNITNSIVVQGPPSGLEIVERLLEQLDVKADQVMISTVFGQLTLGNDVSTGVDWLMLFQGNSNGSGVAGSINPAGNFFNPARLNSFGGQTTNTDGSTTGTGFPNSAGLSLYGKIGKDIATYVNLLESRSDFTVLSRPSIFTANNQMGTIASGRRIAVPTNSYNSGTTGQSTNIEYRDVVLKLEVVPLVNSQNEITMQISLVSDDVIGTQTIEGIGDVPIIGTREIITTVTVPNNETVVLGGLISENDQTNVTGIPVLSSIPGLGRLFSTNTDSKDRDELLVFIQPTVVSDNFSLDNVQTDFDGRYKVAPGAREFGEGPSVLPAAGEITVDDGKSGRRTTIVTPAASQIDSSSILKPSIRPIHRR